MNINFNTFVKKIIPFLIAVVLAYIVATVVFLFLPKSGIGFLEDSKSEIGYQKYDGFYSKLLISKIPSQTQSLPNKKIQTLSRYTLKAVYSTSTNGGWIIVEDKTSKKSTILGQNEEFNGYTLIKLFKNYVLFEKDSQEYKLELPKEKEINYEINNSASNLEEKIVVKEDSVSVNRNYLNSYVNNLDKVWNSIAIKDIRNNGKIEGFKINMIKRNSVFGKLGLKQGDIIKSVNGKVIKSYADAFKIYRGINKLDFLNIEVLRNNELMELNYEID